MKKLSSFYFLRHGQTDWNKQRICQGQTDVPLNATGLDQARDAKALLAGIPIVTVVASPLSRAYKTAEIVNEALNCPLVTVDGLQEMYFGEQEGKPVTASTHEELFADACNWGGETIEDFSDRAIAAVEESLSHPGPVLVVAHGGVYWAVAKRFGMETGAGIANAQPVHIKRSETGGDPWSALQIRNIGDAELSVTG